MDPPLYGFIGAQSLALNAKRGNRQQIPVSNTNGIATRKGADWKP
jgi:hypothetical protein